MTTSQEPRRQQVERLRRLIREAEEREAMRDRAAFEESLAALVQRASTRPPPPPPEPAPAPTRPARPLRPPADPSEVWWSPKPVLGYRVWELRENRLHGAWTPWETSRKTAVCLDKQSKATGPVPHDASECRHPPCGIYALKGTRKVEGLVERSILYTSVPMTLAIGLVAMSGRVVEHEMGYRAEHVEAVALAMVTGAVGKHTVLATIERDDVPAAFTDPATARTRIVVERFIINEAVRRAITWLRERERAIATN